MKKVLYVSNRTGYSGAEVVLVRLIQNNSQVKPIVFAPRGLLPEKLEKLGVEVHYTKNVSQLNRKQNKNWKFEIIEKWIFGFFEFIYILLKTKPDIVHANGLGASIYSSIPTKLFHKPFIWTHHDVFQPGSIESNWIKRLNPFYDKVISVSNYVSHSLTEIGINRKKIRTIYNGLDTTKFSPNNGKRNLIRSKLKIDKSIKIISLFALITAWKGHHIAIAAAKILKDKGRNDFCLVFVGDTDDRKYRKKIGKLINKLGLNNVVHFLGFVEDVVSAYNDTDILLNASIKPEPFGTTIYEGMAMKKIVIASQIGGNPEIIENGKTGFLVKPSSPKKLAEKIEYVLDRFTSLDSVREEARKSVVEKFDLNKMIDNYNEVYEAL